MVEDISNKENSLLQDSILDEGEGDGRIKLPDWYEEKLRLAEEKYKKGEITIQENLFLFFEAIEELDNSQKLSDEVIDAMFGLDNMDSETLK